ncbi:hypothetical protein N7491_000285 [Penicillium cf. griseofulvum]|uniref:Mid2 domain-containing protein n=1 Tax=Penicillium cf. griseofulvum TaxID=2972120 RepID=A0A9W9JR42_9EURO|nr:hypothetical protein N7472_004359 [Penicillium cf. griseofulvum]KAJ5451103.1 hypothetical protein N7491_000285 [Penicillium cf. griseofulvum]
MESWSLLQILALQLNFLSLITTISATGQCYYPNGDRSTDTPCYTDGSASHCCGSHSICLTNKLCLSIEQPYQLSRGSCTDQDWRSGSCPLNTCQSAQPGAGAAVVWLNGTDSESTYCCNSVLVDQTSSKKFCSSINGSPQSNFSVADGYIIPGVAGLSDLVKESNSTSSVVANKTSTATTTGSSTTSNDSRSVAIGVGAGVPLGVIAIFTTGWALWERRKRKRASLYPVQLAQPVVANDRSFEVSELGTNAPKPAELYPYPPRG